jgi:hypothetical protein
MGKSVRGGASAFQEISISGLTPATGHNRRVYAMIRRDGKVSNEWVGDAMVRIFRRVTRYKFIVSMFYICGHIGDCSL